MRLYRAHAEGDLTLYLGEAESPQEEERRDFHRGRWRKAKPKKRKKKSRRKGKS